MVTKRGFSVLALIMTIILLTGGLAPVSVEAFSYEEEEKQGYLVGFEAGSVRSMANLKVEKNFSAINASKVIMTEREAEDLRNQPGISFVEPDHPVYAMSQTVTWGVERVYNQEQYPFETWETTSGQGIRVAVLDTGINEAHEDIPMLLGGYNAMGDETYWGTDLNGHGTHVAGIISAIDNEWGVVGVSPAIDLYGVKVLDARGSGSVSTIIAGIQWAMDNEIHIINMSLGTFEYSAALEQICNEAYASGILLIAAAGNSGTINGTGANISYPALFESVMAVTASDQTDNRANFSSTGVQAEVMAPGVDVLSTIPDNALNSNLSVSDSGIAYLSKMVEGSGIGVVSGPMVDIGLATDLEVLEEILLEKNISPEDEWIALIDRGVLTFAEKVSHAMDFGAEGAIIMNDSETHFEQENITLYATESDKEKEWIPSIFVSYETGQDIRVNDQHGTLTVGYTNYSKKNGTSMAAPHVSAVAAVLWAADPTMSNTDIRQVITATALDLGLPQEHQGYGLVQLNSGLQLILSQLEPVEQEPLALFDFVAEDKIYDGNPLARGRFSDSRKEGDLLEFSYDLAFMDNNVGSDKIVNFSNIEISGGLDQHKYFLTTTTGQAIANINPAVVIGRPMSPEVTYGDEIPDYFIDFVGFVEGEGIENLDQFQVVIDSDYALGMPVGTYNLTVSAITLSALNYEFNITETNTFEVDPRALNLDGSFTVQDKVFDGTRSAEILENRLSLQGALEGDDVYVGEVTVEFVSSEAGKGVEVQIVDIVLAGEDRANYALNLEQAPESQADIHSPPTPPSPPSGGGSSGGGGGFFPIMEDDPIHAVISGQDTYVAGTIIEGEDDGVSFSLITLDHDKIQEIILDLEGVQGNRMSLSIDKKDERIEIAMSKDTVDLLKENKIELEILTPIGGTIMPMNLISLDPSIKALGENIREHRLEIRFVMEVPQADELDQISKKIQSLGMTHVADPVAFSLIVKYGDLTETIDRFQGYTTKLVPLKDNVHSGIPFTGVVFDDQNAFHHLPSKWTIIDGRAYALIRSMSHSTYTAIRNEVFSQGVANHWSKDAVNDMISKRVITNLQAFEPEAYITRVDFADYITKALGLYGANEGYQKVFSDVDNSELFADAISMAAAYGIVEGYTDGTFKPNNTITRQEAMTMYARAMEVMGLTYQDTNRMEEYVDEDKVADWAYKEVSQVLNAGVFNGTSPTTLSPESTFKYGEAATAIKNLLNVYMENQ